MKQSLTSARTTNASAVSHFAPTRDPRYRSPIMTRSTEPTRADSDAPRNAEPPAAAHRDPSAGPRRGKRRVLVVDDEKDLVDMIGYNLQRNGYDVLTAFDGNAALDLA